MAHGKKGTERSKAKERDVVRISAKGHEATIDRSGDQPQLLIDGRPVGYGTDASGQFYLTTYAFDRAGTLDEVVEKYLGYLEQVDASRNA
jgi:hypothetical protein